MFHVWHPEQRAHVQNSETEVMQVHEQSASRCSVELNNKRYYKDQMLGL